MEIPQKTWDEITARIEMHSSVLMTSKNEDQYEDHFIVAFVAFVEDIAARMPASYDPYAPIAAFVHGALEGKNEIADLPALKSFIAAFSAYAKSITFGGAAPHEPLARFVYGLIMEDRRELIDVMLHPARGVA